MTEAAIVFGVICFVCSPGVIFFAATIFYQIITWNWDFSDSRLGLGFGCTLIFTIGIILLISIEQERKKTMGRECEAVCLDGLPGFKCEQAVHLTLNLKDLSVLFSDRKETEVCLKFQQIIKLNYICWEGNVVRWKSGSNGYSYPGFFEGTRVYVPPTSGYSYTEKLKVDWALEIQYRDQRGLRDRIVLKIGRYDDYVDKWLETLCRCTKLPSPQYVEPVKPVKPGPKYL